MYLVDRRLYLSPEERKLKKITGTRFPELLGRSRHHSPFEAAVYMTGARHGHYAGDRNVTMGRQLEPWQIELAQKKLSKVGIQVQSWEQAYGPDVYDAWPENPIFGGKWDALGFDRYGSPFVLIECKTTKYKPQLYENHRLQTMYYAYLTGARWAMILMTRTPFAGEPGEDVFSGRTSRMWWIDMQEARPEIERYMAEAAAWYRKYVLQGITPQYDPARESDVKVLRDLVRQGKLPASVLAGL